MGRANIIKYNMAGIDMVGSARRRIRHTRGLRRLEGVGGGWRGLEGVGGGWRGLEGAEGGWRGWRGVGGWLEGGWRGLEVWVIKRAVRVVNTLFALHRNRTAENSPDIR